MVESIDVIITKSGFNSPYVVPLVQEMMGRKCKFLRYEDKQFPVSLVDAMKLVQVNL